MTKNFSHPKFLQRGLAFLSHHLPIPWDKDHLIKLLHDAEKRHILDMQSFVMIEGILQVAEMHVRDIMIPRSQMIVIKVETPFSDILPLVIESAHSRFPVVDENDEIVGIMLAKDLLAYLSARSPISEQETREEGLGMRASEGPQAFNFNIYDIMRPSIVVPESKRLNSMLQDFRRSHNHMAIVVNEYGQTVGLITIEDVLEQIVGEIEDEYDVDDELLIKKHSETQFIVKAFTPIEDFNEYFNCKFSDEVFDTVGGLVTHALGHLPQRGEKVVIENFRFRVLHADNRRIRLLRVTLLK